MPIKLQKELPAVKILENENIFVMTEERAIKQDIRPLKILILNLMPTKVDTETQLSRLLGNTPLQVEIELIHTESHKSKNTCIHQKVEKTRNRFSLFKDLQHLGFEAMASRIVNFLLF